ncbi:TetR/AcrR family transcriptional regulator [Chloroflexota bacterium]
MAKRGRPVREEDTAAQKENILNAAGQVFTKKGYQRSTTKAIAGAAGVSEGAIYYHFDSKKDLLLGVLDRLLVGIEPKMGNMSTDIDFRTLYTTTVKARIKHVQPSVTTLFSLLSDVLTDTELAQHLYRTNFVPLIKQSEDLLKKFIEKREVRQLDISLTARLSLVLGLGIDLLYLMGDETIRAEVDGASDNLADTISTVILDGISHK